MCVVRGFLAQVLGVEFPTLLVAGCKPKPGSVNCPQLEMAFLQNRPMGLMMPTDLGTGTVGARETSRFSLHVPVPPSR